MVPHPNYSPLPEAWKKFVLARSQALCPKLLDPDFYRPGALQGHWDLIGPNPVTGNFRREPAQRIKDYAETVPDLTGRALREREMMECQFWQDFCSKDGNAFAKEGDAWRALRFDEWEAIRPALWRKVKTSDPDRTDWGPKSWLALEIGDAFPFSVVVQQDAFDAFAKDNSNFFGPDHMQNPSKPSPFSSEESDLALRRNAALSLQASSGFTEFSNAIRLIHTRSRLSEKAIIAKFLNWLRNGELCTQGVPVENILKMAANSKPQRVSIPEAEWREMELVYRELPVRGWVATGIYRPGGMPIGAMALVVEHEKTRPRYCRLLIQTEVIGLLVSEFPRQADRSSKLPLQAPEREISQELERVDGVSALTNAEAAVVLVAKQLWTDGCWPAGMTATKRNEAIQRELSKASLGRSIGERTIRGALGKAGLLPIRQRAS